MNQELVEILKRSTPAEARTQLNLSAHELDARVLQLTACLNGQNNPSDEEAVFTYVKARSREDSVAAERASKPLIYPPDLVELREWARCRFLPGTQRVTPELLEWASRTFNVEEFLAGLREVEATGGLQFEDFIHNLEQEVKNRE